MNEQLVAQAARALKEARAVVVFTGAGVSAESGVPTFRDALTGLWARYRPEELATPQAFRANPKLVWDWYEFRRELVRAARPNPAHLAIAELQRLHPDLLVVTQNVDDLHEQAGSRDVLHLHGNIAQTKCFNNCQGTPTLVDISGWTIDPDHTPPACPHCGGWLRPNVVWFNEALPFDVLEAALEASQRCAAMLVIGTSGVVYPAARIPLNALARGIPVFDVNPYQSQFSQDAVWLPYPAGEVMPRIVEAYARL